MKPDGFGGRLAFLRWLSLLSRPDDASDRRFATRAGVGYEWLKKWMRRDDAPNERVNTGRLVSALEADPEWLLDGAGDPPRPELWSEWLSSRTRRRRPEPADLGQLPKVQPSRAKQRKAK